MIWQTIRFYSQEQLQMFLYSNVILYHLFKELGIFIIIFCTPQYIIVLLEDDGDKTKKNLVIF